jgi:transcriptional regulator with XRE-family HTH domain
MIVNKDIAERINLLVRRHKKGNIAQFANSINITRSSMSKIYRGEVSPSLTTLQAILEVYPDTDGTWLITGVNSSKSQEGHENILKEDRKRYGNDGLLDLIKTQFKIKDEQIKNQAENIRSQNKQIIELIKKIK